MKTFIGIDPGKSGAIACILENGSLWVTPVPVAEGEYDIAGIKEGFIVNIIQF